MNGYKKPSLETFQVFNAIQDYVAIIDKSFTVLDINTAYLKLLGKGINEIVGKKCYAVLRGSLCQSEKCPLKRIIRKPAVIEFETEKRLVDGSRVPLILTATPIYTTDGKLTGIVHSFKDISDLKVSSRKLERILDGVIKALAATVEAKDPYTSGHQEQVTRISENISRKMGLSEDRIKTIWMAATIHDVGKIYVPAEFLAKPSQLTDLEYNVIKAHVEVGYSIIKKIGFDRPVAEIVRQHHERMDCSGYPLGLSGDEILLEARIVAVADVVEAMSSHRPYRPALGMDKAVTELKKNKGILYDHQVVDAFLEISDKNSFFK